jgi:hypothetical protein
MVKNIPSRNRSPTGWWIASYLERAAWKGEKKLSAKAKCYAWENTIILKARDRDTAYKKAVSLGSANTSSFADEKSKRTGRWIFMGLTDLSPLYEPLADGAEILWAEHSCTFQTLKRRAKKKAQLEVFDDTPAVGDTNA